MPPLTVNQALQQAIDHQNHGRLAEAESLYRQILAKIPDQPEVLHLLGLLRHQSGDNDAAEQLVRGAITVSPNQPRFQLTLGTILQARGKFDDAIQLYLNLLTATPSSADAHHHLGVALSAAGRLKDAELALRHAHRFAPDDPAIAGNLGITLCHLNRHEEAATLLHQAIAAQPTPDFHAALAGALCSLGQFDPAMTSARQALALDPAHPHAHHALSTIYTALDRHVEALAEAKLAADALPTVPDIQLHYGACLEKLGRLDDAAAVYRAALKHAPNSAPLHNNLGNLLKNQGLLDEAITHYRQAIAAAPTNAQFHSNLLFTLHFHPHLTQQAIIEEHRHFNETHALPLAPAAPPAKQPTANRRLRIGYIGMQFLAGYHLLSLIAHHDKSQFEIFLYSNTPKPDAQTERFRQHADHFTDVRQLTDDQLAALIRRDQIDILIDTSLHMGNNRILVLARKPAPVQLSFFGYPATTGLTAIDHHLSDRYLGPIPTATDHEPLTTESLSTYWCYHPHIQLPNNPLPAQTNKHITFGNLNNFCKINDPTLELWAQILAAVPNSRLLMMTHEGSHRDRTRNFFQHRHITPDRIDFVPFLPPEKYFAVYHRIDIGLDSFPYNGHTTSLDALYMGVPVLTIIGNTPVSRAGYSQLMNLNLPELAAKTPADFIQLATTLAHDLPRLAALRANLRQRMAASPLMNAPSYARQIEELYRQAWNAL